MRNKISDPVYSPAHYTVYPVQPIEITRHLGFCLGNAVKYALRAPWKGGVEDCDKALSYLSELYYCPQPPMLYHAYNSCRFANEKLQEYLRSAQGDLLWQDVSHYQAAYLWDMQNYLSKRTDSIGDEHLPLSCMQTDIESLRRVLTLRDTTGQIYDGMSGMPEESI